MSRHLAFVSLAVVALGACDYPLPPNPPDVLPPAASLDQQLRDQLRNWFVIPIAAMPPQNPALVDLGQALMFDKVLSGNRDISCASCHEPGLTVTDGMALSVGTGGTGDAPARTLGAGRDFVPRNSPSLINVGLGLTYIFWDGRVSRAGFGPGPVGPPLPPGIGISSPAGAALPAELDDVLAAQAMFPVVNRAEMRGQPGDLDRFGNANELAQYGDSQFVEIWRAVMRRLVAIPEYVSMFNAAFPGVPASSLGFQHAAIAIAAFEKEAFTRTHSRFDRFLAGDNGALTTDEKRGALFFFGEARCASCHNGPFLGGNNFANVGVPQIGPGTGKGVPLDLGFGETLNEPFYNFAFRVAPLRNVELTAPYMHSGAYQTLEAVVTHYSDPRLAQLTYDVDNQLPAALRPLHHGDPATTSAVLQNLDFRVTRPEPFTDSQKRDLVAFLKTLTDPSARDLSSIVPASVPSGLPVRD